MTPERRERLREKGRRLYHSFCGSSGEGSCAEGFAAYHLERGEIEIVEDLLGFLREEIVKLRRSDPERHLEATLGLAARIERRLSTGDATGRPP